MISSCRGLAHLREELARVEALGGEGLMMRQPRSSYEVGRSTTLLKVKSFQDAEARVVGHFPGAGRHAGRLGALDIETADGTRFSVGTGFSDAERAAPPPLGAVITFRYQELSEGGVPRFPTYVGVRDDVVVPVAVAPTRVAERMFELVDGAASKFWAISVADDTHTVRFGRKGTSGQSKSKQFPDAAAAERDAEALVSEKLRKGYREV
jgi:DNA ligase